MNVNLFKSEEKQFSSRRMCGFCMQTFKYMRKILYFIPAKNLIIWRKLKCGAWKHEIIECKRAFCFLNTTFEIEKMQKKAPKNSVEKSPCLTSVSVADREAISSRAKVDDSKHSNGEKNTAERNGLITISQVNNNVVRVERFGLWLYTCKQIGTICIRFPLVSLCDFHPVCASALFEHTLHGNTPKAKTLGKSA